MSRIWRASRSKRKNDGNPFQRVKKDFDTHQENLRIFLEGEGDCGNLKISRFSGRFPDRRNCFSSACAPEKLNARYTPPRSIYGRASHQGFFDSLRGDFNRRICRIRPSKPNSRRFYPGIPPANRAPEGSSPRISRPVVCELRSPARPRVRETSALGRITNR